MLRKGVNASLTVVVPLDENIFFSEFYGRFLSGTLHAAAVRGWDVHISTLRRQPGSEFRQIWQDAVNRVLNGEMTAQESLDLAQEEAQFALDDAWSMQE